MAPATRRRAAARAPVVEEPEEDIEQEQEEPETEPEEELDGEAGPEQWEEQDVIDIEEEEARPLKFDQALTWGFGKPLSVQELFARLKTLYQELSRKEQIPEKHPSRALIKPKAQELAHTQLMGHRDKGVKAWTQACIAQMIRVTAPDALYKQSQLKDFFVAFASSVIPALASPSDAYHRQHMDVLNSLSSFRSIVLITDIPGSDNIIVTLFANCFDVLSGNMKGTSGEPLPKSLEYHITNIMSIILEERGNLPDAAIDILLAQFLRADPEAWAKSGKELPRTLNDISPAYNVARGVCNAGADMLRGAIGKYFNSVLIDASEAAAFSSKTSKPRGRKRTHDESEDESDDGMVTPPAEGDFGEVEKAHRLLRELWRSSPDVIEDAVPQMEPEIKAENVELRKLAVQTIGDMAAGVGAAGPPPPTPLNPAAYPSQSLEPTLTELPTNALYTPLAHHDFAMKYQDCYHEFVARRNDKSPLVRSAFSTAAARIILTSGGGTGLDPSQEFLLLRLLKEMLQDNDEKVRLATVNAIAGFDFEAIIQKLGNTGGVDDTGSLLFTLAERIRDPKPAVRAAAIELLAKLWGVAAGAISEGSERVQALLGGISSKIFCAIYIQDRQINALVHRVLYESLLPISYPPIKARNSEAATSQRIADSQTGPVAPLDRDAIRVERILVLVKSLDDRAEKAFFSLQQNQKTRAAYMEKFLSASEALHADDTDTTQKKNKHEIAKCIEILAASLADPVLATEHLKTFSKQTERRLFQLIRFCYNPDTEYRKMFNAIKEFTNKIKEGPSTLHPVLETMVPLIRNVSILVYNRSHVKSITAFSRSDGKELGEPANKLLKHISSQNPQAFKAYALEYCQSLKKQAPSSSSPNDGAVLDTLEALADFALRSPEDMPKDRDFYQAMVAFALHGTPPKAAKHAVTIVAASADKKEMYVRDILKQSMDEFEFGAEGFLSKLAALSQMSLLCSEDVDAESAEEVTRIALGKILSHNRTPAHDNDPEWRDEVDDDLLSKLWALKLLVNGIRGRAKSTDNSDATAELRKTAYPVYRLLNTIVENDGELSNTSEDTTPKHYKSQLRLAAAVQLLKLSCTRSLDAFFTHADFNRLSKVAQDPLPEVRAGFAKALKKYLGQAKLPPRFYGLVFMYAFEPQKHEKDQTTNWLRARATTAAKVGDPTIVSVFTRFLSLLAHHPDFSPSPEELQDFVEYILFFLSTVANQETLPLIYSQAERIKSVQDGLDSSKSENLYILSDLAKAIITRFQEEKGWSLPIVSGKPKLPGGIFALLPSGHGAAQKIADRNFLPEELADSLEELVRAHLKPKTKKRKAEGSGKQAMKKPRQVSDTTASKKASSRKASRKTTKTPKKSVEDAIPSSDRRRSTRASNAKSYVEHSDTDDDEELEHMNGDDYNEREDTATPPSSEPPPIAAVKKEKAKAKVPAQATRKPPARNGKAKEKDVMEIPSDSEELSDAPSDLEV